MTYRVEYNGGDVEVFTLDEAIEDAKNAILNDVGPVSGWTVEHDEAINNWFIQGVRSGELVGSTAVVSGPEPIAVPDELPGAHRDGTAAPHRHHAHRAPDVLSDDGGLLHSVSFSGITSTEVFGKATTWLAGRADAVAVTDVAWHQTAHPQEPFELRLYYSSD